MKDSIHAHGLFNLYKYFKTKFISTLANHLQNKIYNNFPIFYGCKIKRHKNIPRKTYNFFLLYLLNIFNIHLYIVKVDSAWLFMCKWYNFQVSLSMKIKILNFLFLFHVNLSLKENLLDCLCIIRLYHFLCVINYVILLIFFVTFFFFFF